MKGKLKAAAAFSLALLFVCVGITNCFGAAAYDVNGDGYFSVDDARLAFSIVSKITKGTTAQISACDANGDGRADLADVNMLFTYATEGDMSYFIDTMKALRCRLCTLNIRRGLLRRSKRGLTGMKPWQVKDHRTVSSSLKTALNPHICVRAVNAMALYMNILAGSAPRRKRLSTI